MITGVEIDFVVEDSLKALEQYQAIFADALEVVEKTSFPTGLNEAVFTLYGTRFHLLDANPEYELFAPTEEDPKTLWFNIMVADIKSTYQRAMDNGASVIQELSHLPEMGVTNAMFLDQSNYIWMLHEIHEEISFEKREQFFKDEFNLD